MAAKKKTRKKKAKVSTRAFVAPSSEVVLVAIESLSKEKREFSAEDVIIWMKLYAVSFASPSKDLLEEAIADAQKKRYCKKVTRKTKIGAKNKISVAYESLLYFRTKSLSN